MEFSFHIKGLENIQNRQDLIDLSCQIYKAIIWKRKNIDFNTAAEEIYENPYFL